MIHLQQSTIASSHNDSVRLSHFQNFYELFHLALILRLKKKEQTEHQKELRKCTHQWTTMNRKTKNIQQFWQLNVFIGNNKQTNTEDGYKRKKKKIAKQRTDSKL